MKIQLQSLIKASVLLIFLGFGFHTQAQCPVTVSKVSDNTKCGSKPCNYDGPTIMINEVMLRPSVGDGSIYDEQSLFTWKGEWIELFNPDWCNAIDISCYFLGTHDGSEPSGFLIPQGTIVPPLGFAVVRGTNAPVPPQGVIDIPITDGSRVCVSGTYKRIWFRNEGGWFAFYNENGVAQDAISWGTEQGINNNPCNPNKCSYSGTLSNGNNITNKTKIVSGTPNQGQSYRRIPDGGAWQINQSASHTQGTCNSACVTPGDPSTCTGSATVTSPTPTEGATYLWSDAAKQTTQTATGLCGGTYTVTVTLSSCTNTSSIVINDPTPPVITISASLDSCELSKGSASVSVQGGQTPFDYKWSNLSQGSAVISGLASGNYSVTVTDAGDCSAASSVVVNKTPAVSLNITNTADNCSKNTGSATVTVLTGSPDYKYKWSVSGSQTANITGLGAGDYTVTVIDAYSCSGTATTAVSSTLPVTVTAGSDSPVCIGKTLNLSASSNEGINFVWNGPLSFSSNEENPIIENVTKEMSGIYTVKVASADNLCEASAQVPVIVKVCDTSKLIVPNVFTPDGDGKNEEFKAEYKAIESFNCIILNRWGKKVYEWDDVSQGWNGKTSGGKDASDGVYYYIITAKGTDEVDYKMHGTITLIR